MGPCPVRRSWSASGQALHAGRSLGGTGCTRCTCQTHGTAQSDSRQTYKVCRRGPQAWWAAVASALADGQLMMVQCLLSCARQWQGSARSPADECTAAAPPPHTPAVACGSCASCAP